MTQRIPTTDGVTLAASVHTPAASSHGVAILLPATGANRQRYEAFGGFLAQQGWHAVTFDYRSIGESVLPDGDTRSASMLAWGEQDLDAVIRWTQSRLAPRRTVLIGHSIGGQIIPFAASHRQVDAVVTVAAQKGHWRLWPAPERYAVWGFFRVYIPLCLKLFGRVPLRFAGLDALTAEVARDYVRWTTNLPYYDANGVDLTPRFADVRTPILALSFADDTQYAPRAAVDFLLQHYYINAPTWRCHIDPQQLNLDGLGHSGFFDPAVCPAALWLDTADWLRSAADGRADEFQFQALPDVARMSRKSPLAPDSDQRATALCDAFTGRASP
jgi:predicted alpha/beta hydrolase